MGDDGRKGYAQLSNGYWRNVKIAELREVCTSAVGMYSMMLSYSSDRMTDGYVERKAARYLLRATDDEIAALIEAGLITETTDGYQIHDYLKHNNSRDQIMHKRQREKRRYEAKKESSAEVLPAEIRQKSDRIGTNIKHKTQNKKEEEFYWRTVRDVRKTLPYAKLICSTLLETYEYLETFETKKEKEQYLKQFEKEVFKQYKPVMKTFTRSQGRMLCKLINRETDQTSYNIVKAFLGSFRAGFWSTFGRFFGVNMKNAYKPDTDATDAMIERICVRIEQGSL